MDAPAFPISLRHRHRVFGPALLGLGLLVGMSCHGAAQAPGVGDVPTAPADPLAVVERTRILLIAPRDGGRGGHAVGCGDSAIAVEAPLPHPVPALEGALRALLADREQFDHGSGLLNALYASRLDLVGVELHGSAVLVRLTGYIELGDRCDNARLLAQLTETARQFRGIASARFELDGQPLADLLAAEAPPGATAGVPP